MQQRPILAFALPTNVVHGFLRWGGAVSGITSAGGDRHTRYAMGRANQSFLRPDMGVDDALKR